jgi:hypothetical protein
MKTLALHIAFILEVALIAGVIAPFLPEDPVSGAVFLSIACYSLYVLAIATGYMVQLDPAQKRTMRPNAAPFWRLISGILLASILSFPVSYLLLDRVRSGGTISPFSFGLYVIFVGVILCAPLAIALSSRFGTSRATLLKAYIYFGVVAIFVVTIVGAP